jgi:hypothetical protein
MTPVVTVWQKRLLIAILLIMIFEVGSLQPLLDERATKILGDHEVPKHSPHHVIYVVLEVVKVTLLITFAITHFCK